VWLDLGNAAPIKVRALHSTLGSSPGHLIVYRDDTDTTPQTTPVACQPYGGLLQASAGLVPLALARGDETLTLPAGTGYSLAAHQMIRLELQYRNDDTQPALMQATSELTVMDDAEYQDEAGFYVLADPDITVQPGTTQTVDAAWLPWPSSLDGTQIFAATGVTQQYGTGVTASLAATQGGPETPIYAPAAFAWEAPELSQLDPAAALPAGGGFHFSCTYFNSGGLTVRFGESSGDELCLVGVYYHPSQPIQVGLHTDQFGGVNVWCPGDALCAQILPN
jgi:hypothetical protein